MSKKNERNANGKYESSALVGRIRRRFVCLCNNTRRQSSCVRPMIANSVRWTLWKFSKQKSKEFYSSDGIQNKRFLSDICLLKFKTGTFFPIETFMFVHISVSGSKISKTAAYSTHDFRRFISGKKGAKKNNSFFSSSFFWFSHSVSNLAWYYSVKSYCLTYQTLPAPTTK